MCVPVSESMQKKMKRGGGALTLLFLGGSNFKQRNKYILSCMFLYQSKLRLLYIAGLSNIPKGI